MNHRTGAPAPSAYRQSSLCLLSSATLSRSAAVEIMTAPEAVADFIRTEIPWVIPAGTVLKECRPKLIRNRMGSRQVVLYRLFLSDEEDRKAGVLKIVFKRYADKTEGRKTYDIMKMLWERGFNGKSRLRVLEPHAYLEELGLLVMEDAHGMLLVKNLRQSSPAAVDRMRAVGRWLSKLHHLDPDFAAADLHPADAVSIRDFVREAGAGEPRLLPKLEKVESILLAKIALLQNTPLTFVHGDFQCENILVDRDKVIGVDFDRFSISDPARDLGCMIAQTRTMGLLAGASPYSIYLELKAFWEEYLTGVPAREREELSARSSLFAARKCLQNVYYMAVVLPVDKKGTFPILLREAERFAEADSVEAVMEVPISFGYGRPLFVNGEMLRTKQAFAKKIVEIGKPEFLRRYACSVIPECRPEEIEVITRHNDGIGPAAVEFRKPGGEGFMGMLYPDDSGARAHEVLTALWKNGFDRMETHQVPEPLGYVPGYRLLLLNKTSGDRLDARLDQDAAAILPGVKEAARWLLKLHGSAVRIGAPNHPWRMVEKLAAGIAAMAASHPGEIARIVSMLDRLSASVEPVLPEEVQVHGSFRPKHLFVNERGICAVGLAQSQPSDPAEDLAEFVHRLRMEFYRLEGTVDRAIPMTDAFLEAYGAGRSSGLVGLPFHRGIRILVTMCRHMREISENDPEWGAVAAFYDREFTDAIRRAAPPGQGGEQQTAAAATRDPGEDDFRARAAELIQPAFVAKVVYPALFGRACGEAGLPPLETALSQEDRQTGRVTVSYRFGEEVPVFGKLYPAGESHAFEVMEKLREKGFGDGPYRVAEPLAYIPGHNLLLTRGATGEPLVKIIGERRPDAVESARRAARWLVRLHASPLRIGPEETFWNATKLLTAIRHLAKVAAGTPRERSRYLERIERLCRKAGENPKRPPVVQTHGSFHGEHIFVTPDEITVIDFDKSFPADPARDLAEFLALLRRWAFKREGTPGTVREPTRAFLDEYRRHLPGNMESLPLYWGAAILVDLFHYQKKRPRERLTERMIGFLKEDFDAVLSQKMIRD